MKLNNTPLYVVRTIVCFVLFTVLVDSTAAQARYKRLHLTDPMTRCDDGVFVEESMPQERIDYLWNNYGEDSVYKYCFIRDLEVLYTNNHEFMREFRSISPPENISQVIPEDKFYMLGPQVTALLRDLESMYDTVRVTTKLALYNNVNPSDTAGHFWVIFSSDSFMNLGHLNGLKEQIKRGTYYPPRQMNDLGVPRCATLVSSVRNSEPNITEQPTLVVASGVTIPRGTDVGQPFAVVDVRGRTVYSGATTAGPSSTMIYLPAGVYVVLTPTTRQRVLVVP